MVYPPQLSENIVGDHVPLAIHFVENLKVSKPASLGYSRNYRLHRQTVHLSKSNETYASLYQEMKFTGACILLIQMRASRVNLTVEGAEYLRNEERG